MTSRSQLGYCRVALCGLLFPSASIQRTLFIGLRRFLGICPLTVDFFTIFPIFFAMVTTRLSCHVSPLGVQAFVNGFTNDSLKFKSMKAFLHWMQFIAFGSYDLAFSSRDSSEKKGMRESFDFCLAQIKMFNGSDYSLFGRYHGGVVSIIHNDSGSVVFSANIP